MQRVYTNQFLVHGRDGQDGKAVAEAVQATVHEWLTGSLTGTAVAGAPPLEVGKNYRHGNCRVDWVRMQGAKAALLQVEYHHPDSKDPSQVWRTSIRVSRFEEAVEFHLDMYAGHERRLMSPTRLAPLAPRIIELILTRFDCIAGGHALRRLPMMVNEVNLGQFVSGSLLSPDRTLPIVVISPDNASRRPLVNAEKMAHDLAGLAEVALLEDLPTTHRLTSALGRKLSCFNGGVRIYWAPLTKDAQPHSHPLTIGIDIEQERARRQSPENRIRAQLFALACDVMTEGALLKMARDQLGREAAGKIKATQDVEKLKARIEELETLVGARDAEIADLRQQLADMQRAWREAELPREPQAAARSARRDPIEEVEEMRTADQVIALLEPQMDRLTFHNRARQSSRGYASRHLVDLYRTLDTLNDMATDNYSKDPPSLGLPFDKWVERRERSLNIRLPDFKLHEAQTTLEKYGAPRTIRHGNSELVLEKHATMGQGDSEGCIQVYWEWDPASQGILVGYIGKHLPYVSEHG